MPPGLTCGLGIGLQAGLADCGGDHGVLALRHVRQSVAHPMNSASLPSRTEHAADRVAQTLVGVRNHQLDALETTLDQALEESRPKRLGLRGTDAEPDDLASAFGRDRHSDYRSDRDNAAAVAHFEVGGVEPKIRPFALDRPVEKGIDPFVDVLAQLGDLAL